QPDSPRAHQPAIPRARLLRSPRYRSIAYARSARQLLRQRCDLPGAVGRTVAPPLHRRAGRDQRLKGTSMPVDEFADPGPPPTGSGIKVIWRDQDLTIRVPAAGLRQPGLARSTALFTLCWIGFGVLLGAAAWVGTPAGESAP